MRLTLRNSPLTYTAGTLRPLIRFFQLHRFLFVVFSLNNSHEQIFTSSHSKKFLPQLWAPFEAEYGKGVFSSGAHFLRLKSGKREECRREWRELTEKRERMTTKALPHSFTHSLLTYNLSVTCVFRFYVHGTR